MTDNFISLDSDFLNDLNPVHIFMSGSKLSDELLEIRSAVIKAFPNVASLPANSSPKEEDIIELITSIFEGFPFSYPPTQLQLGVAFRQVLAPLQESQISLLVYCLTRCGLAIESVVADHNIDTFLVPNVWHLRWNHILCGSLYPANVGFWPLYN